MPLKIVRNDIIKMQVDAVVNTANNALKMGGGVCGDIFAAAGADELQAACDAAGPCKTGKAVITKAYRLPAKYIIHTVGPIWQGGGSGEQELLHDCYIHSLYLAAENYCGSVAFPLISSGIYGYPREQALQTAVSAITEFLLTHEMMVFLVVYDRRSFILSEKLSSAVENFIDDNYVAEHRRGDSRRGIEPYESLQINEIREMHPDNQPPDFLMPPMSSAKMFLAPGVMEKRSLEDVLKQLDETFPQMLLRLIDEKGMTDVETYKRANIDRKLFSKIRSGKDYNPSKATAIAFAIALRLNLDQTKDLLNKAGFTLSRSCKFDVIIEFFITEESYDIFEINQVLFKYGQTTLGV